MPVYMRNVQCSGRELTIVDCSYSRDLYMRNVQCSGRELTIVDCSYSRDLSNNSHSNDLGIRCGKGGLHNNLLC